jgi:hypothetical protein
VKCCEPKPCEPANCCEADPCCKQRVGFFARRQARKCCEPVACCPKPCEKAAEGPAEPTEAAPPAPAPAA